MSTAGKMRDRYRFEQRGLDANGDRLGAWDAAGGITVAAETIWLRGMESVMAARLEGKQPVALVIRDSAAARTITTGFRAVDVRTLVAGAVVAGTTRIFNITGASPSSRTRGFIDVLAVSGGAAG